MDPACPILVVKSLALYYIDMDVKSATFLQDQITSRRLLKATKMFLGLGTTGVRLLDLERQVLVAK